VVCSIRHLFRDPKVATKTVLASRKRIIVSKQAMPGKESPTKYRIMKLHLADSRNRYTFTGHGAGYVAVNGIRYEQPLIVTPDHEPQPWPVPGFSALDATATAVLLENNPEIVIIGTGPVQLFADPARIRPLIEAGIGLEMMNSPAACRTYNILMGEGRRVVAAMFLP